jgi:hypothetical protein
MECTTGAKPRFRTAAPLGLKNVYGPRTTASREENAMLNTHDLATAWLLRHARDLTRPKALEACTRYLVAERAISEDTAGRIALQALAELESRNQRARVDTIATTAHLVVIHRPDGQRPLAFTVADLLRLYAAQSGGSAPRLH